MACCCPEDRMWTLWEQEPLGQSGVALLPASRQVEEVLRTEPSPRQQATTSCPPPYPAGFWRFSKDSSRHQRLIAPK